MSLFELMIGTWICLQIGNIRTILLDVPKGGKTTRISLPEPYKNLPLKAERLDENYKKLNTSDDMWPCVLTGKQDESHPQIFNNIDPAQVPSNQSAKEESNQQTQANSNQPTQVQSDTLAQAQSRQPTVVRSDIPAQTESSQPIEVRSNQPIQMQSSQPTQIQSNQPKQVQFNEKDPAKIDVEPTKINAKLTIV